MGDSELLLLGQLEQNSKACRCYFYHPLLSQHLGSYPVPVTRLLTLIRLVRVCSVTSDSV